MLLLHKNIIVKKYVKLRNAIPVHRKRTQCTMHIAQYTVHSTQYTVHSTQYTVHSAQYT